MKCKDCIHYSKFFSKCEEHGVLVDEEELCPDYCHEIGDSFSFLRELKGIDSDSYYLIKS